MNFYQLIIDFNYGLSCRFCNFRVLDPDKSKSDVYITSRCPQCHKSPADEKKARKQSRKEKIKSNNKKGQ
jgi:hypothetical protein